MPLPRRRLALLVAVALGALVLDIATKTAVVATMHDGERIPLLGDGVSLILVRNPGAAFSLATGMTWVLTLVALAVVIGIARYARRLRSAGWAVGLGLVLGGATGNLVDRFFRGPGPLEGHVVDFVSVGWWPVFNVADSAICVGGAVLVVLAVWGLEIDGTRREEPPEKPEGPDMSNPDERAVKSARIRWPKHKWDAALGPAGRRIAGDAQEPPVGAELDDDVVDEDDRLPADRPRYSGAKWENR